MVPPLVWLLVAKYPYLQSVHKLAMYPQTRQFGIEHKNAWYEQSVPLLVGKYPGWHWEQTEGPEQATQYWIDEH